MTEIKPPYDELDTIINEYVDGYELTGDEGSYTPTLTEKLLIKDAIHGLLADTDWDNAWGRYIAALAKSQPVEQGEPVRPMSDEQIEKLRGQTFSINNPFCPVDSKSFRKAVHAAEYFHGIKGATE